MQVVTTKDLTLPIMILTQSDIEIAKAITSSGEATSSTEKNSIGKCQLAFCDGICYLHDVEHLFEPFIMILKDCNKPTALYNLLLPVIER